MRRGGVKEGRGGKCIEGRGRKREKGEGRKAEEKRQGEVDVPRNEYFFQWLLSWLLHK